MIPARSVCHRFDFLLRALTCSGKRTVPIKTDSLPSGLPHTAQFLISRVHSGYAFTEDVFARWRQTSNRLQWRVDPTMVSKRDRQPTVTVSPPQHAFTRTMRTGKADSQHSTSPVQLQSSLRASVDRPASVGPLLRGLDRCQGPHQREFEGIIDLCAGCLHERPLLTLQSAWRELQKFTPIIRPACSFSRMKRCLIVTIKLYGAEARHAMYPISR